MSHVRQCDECGFIFSENAEGWGNGTVTKMVRDPETGRIKPKEISIDYCPTCVEAKEAGAAPIAPVPPTVNEKRPMLTNGDNKNG